MTAQAVGYVGKQYENGFVGFIALDNFFVILSLEEGATPADGQKFLDGLKQAIHEVTITNLSEFESQLSAIIVKMNFPAHFSLASGYLNNNVLYVKTVGKGQIYYRRGHEFDLLMDGDKSASGYIQEYDCAIFTTLNSREQIGAASDMKAFVDMSPPYDIVEKLKNEKYDEHASGFISLFVEFSSHGAVVVPNTSLNPALSIETLPQVAPASPVIPVTPAQPPIQPQEKSYVLPKIQFFASKKFTIVAVIIVFAILVWSVIFGVQRRAAAELQKKFDESKTKIETSLEKASSEAFINFDQSVTYIDEAKNELVSLKQQLGKEREKEIAELEKQIRDAENAVVKREEKPFEEFFDLALEDKDVTGSTVYLDGDKLAILDNKNSTVYIVSLDKKSITSYVSSDVKDGSLVALYENQVFFFSKSRGIYKFESESKSKQVIKPDSGWGNVVDMEVYNGNIYLLDSGRDEVYKYLVAESGYSDKSSYFQEGQSVDLESAVDMSIDSAIYVALKNEILKYITGVKDQFVTSFPEPTPNIEGIYTNGDMEQIFVWDKGVGNLYVLEKDGKYNRQIASSIIRKAKNVVVYKDKAIVFDGVKLYSISLD